MVLCSLSFSVDGLPPSAVAASLIGREKGRGCPALSGSVAYWSPVSGLSAVGVSGEDLPAVSVCRSPVAGRLVSFRVLWSGCLRPGFSAVVLWLPAFSMDGSPPSAVAAL